MIEYTNVKRHDNLPFDQYLKIPGTSHSFLKQQQSGITPVFNMTDNIKLGSIVDSILTDPKTADMSHALYPASKNIAATLSGSFAGLIKTFKKQVSFTANIEYCGLSMPTKGRLDFLLPGLAVIDLKITQSKNLKSLIDYMGYSNQVWHYAKLANVQKGYLMIYSVPLKRSFIVPVDVTGDNDFWKESVLNFGKALAF